MTAKNSKKVYNAEPFFLYWMSNLQVQFENLCCGEYEEHPAWQGEK